jgi:HD-GYP domain-containing protein (c-di-GMP phosphodiesterase class II)
VPKVVADGARADCEVGADLSRRLRLPEAVSTAVLDAFERWDGKGNPEGKAGQEVAQAARCAAVGYAAVMFDAVGGPGAASEMVGRWSGRALDPSIATVFAEAPGELLDISNPDDLWAAVVDLEPEPRRTFANDAAIDEALAGFGDAADLKSPWFQGHARGVARLVRAAAEHVASEDAELVHRAGLVHDLGRVAVPTGIWERPGPLRADEWELVRLHPYNSGRILARSPVLAALGAIATATTSASTARATRPASGRPSSSPPPACSPPLTCSTRSASPVRTGRRSRSTRPRARCRASRLTARRSAPCWTRPTRPRPSSRRCRRG